MISADPEYPESTPTRMVLPGTRETLVVLREAEYERPKEEYDDCPWTREELQALAGERVKHEDCYGTSPPIPKGP